MNKMLAAMAISISALLATDFAAASPENEQHGLDAPDHVKNRHRSHDMRGSNDNKHGEQRRPREENGVKRLQQMRWQQGYVMPQHYRGNRYKVEYKDFNLPKPARNQQWYKVNKDYLLVDGESNNIIKIMPH